MLGEATVITGMKIVILTSSFAQDFPLSSLADAICEIAQTETHISSGRTS